MIKNLVEKFTKSARALGEDGLAGVVPRRTSLLLREEGSDDGVSAVHGKAAEEKRTIENYSREADGEVVAGGYRSTAVGLRRAYNEEAAGSDKKSRDGLTTSFVIQSVEQHLQDLRDYADWLDERADYYEAMAEELREEIAELTARQIENSRFIEEAEALLRGYDRNGELNRKAAMDLLRRRGLNVDGDMDDAVLLEMLRHEAGNAEKNNHTIDKEIDEKERQYEGYKEDARRAREEAKKVRDNIEEIESDPSLSEAEKKQKAQVLADENVWDVKLQQQYLDKEEMLPSGTSLVEKEEAIDTTQAKKSGLRDMFGSVGSNDATSQAEDLEVEKIVSAKVPNALDV